MRHRIRDLHTHLPPGAEFTCNYLAKNCKYGINYDGAMKVQGSISQVKFVWQIAFIMRAKAESLPGAQEDDEAWR